MEFIEVSAKTVDDAITKACIDFRLPAINWRSRSSAKAVPDSLESEVKPDMMPVPL